MLLSYNLDLPSWVLTPCAYPTIAHNSEFQLDDIANLQPWMEHLRDLLDHFIIDLLRNFSWHVSIILISFRLNLITYYLFLFLDKVSFLYLSCCYNLINSTCIVLKVLSSHCQFQIRIKKKGFGRSETVNIKYLSHIMILAKNYCYNLILQHSEL